MSVGLCVCLFTRLRRWRQRKWRRNGRSCVGTQKDSEMKKGVTDRSAPKARVTFGIEDAQ